MVIAEIKGLQKKYKSTPALKNVTMELKRGEVLGFIGPNGAGKSTTIRILLGIIKSSGGTAKIFGKDVWKDSIEIHKRLAYVPGDVNLWPNLTGGEIIDVFMRLQGTKNDARRDELIQKFQLDPKKKARTYSKGNRQKVALIAAFASDAELYIFDEPTSGLDPLMEAVFQEQVENLKNQGKSILLSSHILSEVERLCDRVAIIRQGEVIETGTLDELRHLTQYQYKVTTRDVPIGLKQVRGVHDLVINGKEAVFQADSDQIESILEAIIPYHVTKLESVPPTLEALFMRHYTGK
ncbi:ATP-binding cassette domain-containing protein [Priestia megaterium]|uniref:ABC transporter family protein n=1 Tax=Priestia megaterium (strain ATCC 14581 / DSM 32 / CCUG 1817 / JCM 2506 / NBRC 15308 / NCIMB 9376 / NCTC 10342 / NRRL B-14308 / VKM B-512 / Ford 19) TaxID=1348623 RepID=A0A0B6AJW0_PRIM2|nr:ABC transporter ATP-binding protein [Priestia megaterium]AJI20094.1 ABC transporter family protein [Priestia megaterium NBRC 15308 = ATCC 14581]KFM94769.1 ABC transporter family protein [Priestia megaterium]KGJ74137.1 ABC transporter ATP-binding protein [Priestia megaterium NBRC 15308 = ATCC 14581]MED3810154.1 ABC transporter ATP-binding protein [Priestia megaterium]MED4394276.1 ABC transporter ATP-binding protein [Priestia megaterium]